MGGREPENSTFIRQVVTWFTPFRWMVINLGVVLAVMMALLGGVAKCARLEQRLTDFQQSQEREAERIDREVNELANTLNEVNLKLADYEFIRCEALNRTFDHATRTCSPAPVASK